MQALKERVCLPYQETGAGLIPAPMVYAEDFQLYGAFMRILGSDQHAYSTNWDFLTPRGALLSAIEECEYRTGKRCWSRYKDDYGYWIPDFIVLFSTGVGRSVADEEDMVYEIEYIRIV